MFWRKNHREAQKEIAEARDASQESQGSLDEARATYRAALQTARIAKQANARNHFSENLREAYGG